MDNIKTIADMAAKHDFSSTNLVSVLLSDHADYTEEMAEEALTLIEMYYEAPVATVRVFAEEVAELSIKARTIRFSRKAA